MEKNKTNIVSLIGLRNRPDMLAVRNSFGNGGYALMLYLLEDIAENGPLPAGWLDKETRSADYRTDRDTLEAVEAYGIRLGILALEEDRLVSPLLDGITVSKTARKEAGRKGARKRWKGVDLEAVEDVVEDIGELIRETGGELTETPQEETGKEPSPQEAEPASVVDEPHLENTPEPEGVTALPTEILYPRHAQFVDALRDYYNTLVERNGSRMPKCAELSSGLRDRVETLLVTLGKDFLKGVMEHATQDPSCDGDFEWLMKENVLLKYYS